MHHNSKSQHKLSHQIAYDRKNKINNQNKTNKKITMSSLVYLNTQNVQKVSLVNKNIQILDKLAIKQSNSTQRIKILYLSNNYIDSLQNIKQFAKLQTLSLSYNNIQKLSNIKYLSALSKLAHLSLQGNPIHKYPIYLPAILNMNKSYGSLKTVDKISINAQMKEQAIAQYQYYEQRMKQVLLNYFKLVYLVQLGKKEAVHRIIKKAYHNKSQDKYVMSDQSSIGNNYEQTILQISDSELYSQQTSYSQYIYPVQIKIQFYLRRAAEDMQNLPPKYIQVILDSLNMDVYKLYKQHRDQGPIQQMHSQKSSPTQKEIMNYYTNNSQSKNPIEIFMSSIQQMLGKQNCKMQQLKQKIVSKYAECESPQYYRQMCNSNGAMRKSLQLFTKFAHMSKTDKQDVYLATEKINKAWNGKCKQILLYEWKLVAKVFNKLKLNANKRNVMKYASTTICRVLATAKRHSAKLFMINLINYYKVKLLYRLGIIAEQIANKYVKNSFDTILEQVKSKSTNTQFEGTDNQNQLEINQNQLVRKYNTKMNNKKLLRKSWQSWKLLHKNALLQKNNMQLAKQLQNSKMREDKLHKKIQLLSKLLQITEQKLNRKQSKQNDPKQLIKQIQFMQQNRVNKRSPSPQLIRSNNLHKENYNPNKPLILQQKLNSSTNLLRIC